MTMEQLHAWIISLVPTDLILNDTQNVVFFTLISAVIILLGVVLFLTHLYRRDTNVPYIEKRTIELSKKLGEEFHDILVNMSNAGQLTRAEYRWAARVLRIAFPGGIYGYGALSEKTRKLFHTQAVKERIEKHRANGFNLPPVGLQAWQKIVAAMGQPQQEKPKFGTKKQA